MIRPLAIDEMGMSGEGTCIPKLIELAQNDAIPGFTRIKRSKRSGDCARPLQRPLAACLDTRQVWRWVYPNELRIAAAQALIRVDPSWEWKKSPRAVSTERIDASNLPIPKRMPP